MGSTNVFNGVNEDNRTSSRVLRPPGGGATDVLGLHGGPEERRQQKFNPRNVSSIMEGTNQQLPTSPAKSAPKPAVPGAAPTTQSEEPAAKGPERVRVPPGGFSSGLW